MSYCSHMPYYSYKLAIKKGLQIQYIDIVCVSA